MDEFTLLIDEIKFRSTNISWNYLCLNDPWSVGYVSTLIETQPYLSKEQLCAKAKLLHQHVSQKGIDLTVEECIECVRYRTICETWNGIIIRERNTVKKLREFFPNFEFTKTNGELDHQYAVDYELGLAGNIFCGIQIKPKTYTYNTTYILKARNSNIRKNKAYSNTFQRPVFDVISHANGDIINTDVINQIKTVAH